jgi:hypothetical protein
MSTTPPELANFLRLTRAEQAAVIRQLAAAGMSDWALAHASRLSVEQIRRILGRGTPGDPRA